MNGFRARLTPAPYTYNCLREVAETKRIVKQLENNPDALLVSVAMLHRPFGNWSAPFCPTCRGTNGWFAPWPCLTVETIVKGSEE